MLHLISLYFLNVWLCLLFMYEKTNSYPICKNQALIDNDIYALMDFYESSDNTEHWTHPWNYSGICNSSIYVPHGIGTNNMQRVSEINLNDSNISGTLSPRLADLTYLSILIVSFNSFQGIAIIYLFIFVFCF